MILEKAIMLTAIREIENSDGLCLGRSFSVVLSLFVLNKKRTRSY